MEWEEGFTIVLFIIACFIVGELFLINISNKLNEESKKRIDKIFDSAQNEQKKTLRKFGLIAMIIALISNFFTGNNSDNKDV